MYTRSSLKTELKKSYKGSDFDSVIKYLDKIKHIISDNKQKFNVMVFVSFFAVIFALYFVLAASYILYDFYVNHDKLSDASLYELAGVEDLGYDYRNLDDLLQGYKNISESADRYQDYMNSLQLPYNYFLNNLLLPSLYIWKDPYSNRVDTQLVGRRFIDNNPFSDIAMISFWTKFFSDVGDGTDFVSVRSVIVGDMKDNGDFFSIPVNVSFVAPSKRAFVLLVDKLSISSQESNISLINEFFFHLWDSIKVLNEIDEEDEDFFIGRSLHSWIFDGGENNLVSNEVMLRAIRNLAQCSLVSNDVCLYNFRNMYRSIPQLAYGIGLGISQESIESFARFVSEISPVISIDDFNFRAMGGNQGKYEGNINISMYGRNVSDADVGEISYLLGSMCIGDDSYFYPSDVLFVLDGYLRDISQSQIIQQYSTQLLQLRRIIVDIENRFGSINNYQKVIKIFEMYKMLSDAGVCG